jgi:hypothetical protein
MAALAKTDVHHGAPRCLLGLFDAVAGSLADWSEFDAEAERRGIEVRGLSREGRPSVDATVLVSIGTCGRTGGCR